jgi:hypothetical protein
VSRVTNTAHTRRRRKEMLVDAHATHMSVLAGTGWARTGGARDVGPVRSGHKGDEGEGYLVAVHAAGVHVGPHLLLAVQAQVLPGRDERERERILRRP